MIKQIIQVTEETFSVYKTESCISKISYEINNVAYLAVCADGSIRGIELKDGKFRTCEGS